MFGMATWTCDELDQIGKADELEIVTLRRDGTSRKPVVFGSSVMRTTFMCGPVMAVVLLGFVAHRCATRVTSELAASIRMSLSRTPTTH
jgi:hypothetical protein